MLYGILILVDPRKILGLIRLLQNQRHLFLTLRQAPLLEFHLYTFSTKSKLTRSLCESPTAIFRVVSFRQPQNYCGSVG